MLLQLRVTCDTGEQPKTVRSARFGKPSEETHGDRQAPRLILSLNALKSLLMPTQFGTYLAIMTLDTKVC